MDDILSKLVKNVFYEKLTFEKMYEAYERARKNKTFREEVLKFEYYLEKNLVSIITDIKKGKYKLGKYREFKVYESKERIIKSLPFRDRIVHQWVVYEFLNPYVVPKFIYDSYACLKGKGTHKAVKRIEHFMYLAKQRYGNYYIIKMDVKKFFYNINRNILMKIIKRNFKDKIFLKLCETLIFDDDSALGIPIGNYTSQYFANMYLNELDQYIKHELKIKYYVRYMDDFILLVENKKVAKKVFNQVEIFLKEKLKLKLNHKSRYYPSRMGVNFCGYRIFNIHKLIRNRSKKRMRLRIKLWNKLYHEGNLNINKVKRSINSWYSHIKHADSYNLYKKYLEKIDFKIES